MGVANRVNYTNDEKIYGTKLIHVRAANTVSHDSTDNMKIQLDRMKQKQDKYVLSHENNDDKTVTRVMPSDRCHLSIPSSTKHRRSISSTEMFSQLPGSPMHSMDSPMNLSPMNLSPMNLSPMNLSPMCSPGKTEATSTGRFSFNSGITDTDSSIHKINSRRNSTSKSANSTRRRPSISISRTEESDYPSGSLTDKEQQMVDAFPPYWTHPGLFMNKLSLLYNEYSMFGKNLTSRQLMKLAEHCLIQYKKEYMDVIQKKHPSWQFNRVQNEAISDIQEFYVIGSNEEEQIKYIVNKFKQGMDQGNGIGKKEFISQFSKVHSSIFDLSQVKTGHQNSLTCAIM